MKAIQILIVLISALAFSSGAFAKMYRWTDESGNMHFTDSYYKVPEKYRGGMDKPRAAPNTSTQKGNNQSNNSKGTQAHAKLPATDKGDAYCKNTRLSRTPTETDIVEWSIDHRGNAIYSSGKAFLGTDIVKGINRKQQASGKQPTMANLRFGISGGTLSKTVKIEKTLKHRAGDNAWKNIPLASGLGPGTYKVIVWLWVQYVTEDKVLHSDTTASYTLWWPKEPDDGHDYMNTGDSCR